MESELDELPWDNSKRETDPLCGVCWKVLEGLNHPECIKRAEMELAPPAPQHRVYNYKRGGSEYAE